MFGGAQLGLEVCVATPKGYEPKPEAIDWAERRAAQTGGIITVTNDPKAAVAGADIVYADVWTSMGQEDEAKVRKQTFGRYRVDSELFEMAKSDALFMHCLPAHRDEEVSAGVIDSEHSVVFQQAENRLHVQKAILVELMKSVPVAAMRPAPALDFVGV